MCVCRYLQRCPVVFLQSSVVATVTQCGLACSTLGHRDAFSSVMKYFRDLLHLPQQEATVRLCGVCGVGGWVGVVCVGVTVCGVCGCDCVCVVCRVRLRDSCVCLL